MKHWRLSVSLLAVVACSSEDPLTFGSSASTTGSSSASSASSSSGAAGSGATGGGAAGAGGGAAGAGGERFVCRPGASEPCYSGPVGTESIGLCVAGTKACARDGQSFGPCVGEVTPATESCATAGDDDCDGQTNEEGPDCACAP